MVLPFNTLESGNLNGATDSVKDDVIVRLLFFVWKGKKIKFLFLWTSFRLSWLNIDTQMLVLHSRLASYTPIHGHRFHNKIDHRIRNESGSLRRCRKILLSILINNSIRSSQREWNDSWKRIIYSLEFSLVLRKFRPKFISMHLKMRILWSHILQINL